LWNNDVRWVLIAASIALLVCAAWNDVARRIIPNRLSAGVAVLGITHQALVGFSAVGASMAVATILFALLLLLHSRKVVGGGDVKLAAAIALGLPFGATWLFIEATVFVGGVLALLHLTLRPFAACRSRRLDAGAVRRFSTAGRVWAAERWRIRRHGSLPYGVAIGCGGAWALLSGG
jgi:prepilin peptidase CpaA